MTERLIWLNGNLRSEREAVVSIYDSALLYGDSVFEMLRSFNRIHFRVREHLDRLAAGAVTLGIPVPSPEAMAEALADLTAAHLDAFAPDDEVRTLITASRGVLPLYRQAGLGAGEPWLMICQYPLRWVMSGAGVDYRQGVTGVVTSVPALPDAAVPCHVKHHNRIHFRRAEAEANQRTTARPVWALVVTPDGNAAEATGANCFTVDRRGRLWTPPTSVCLPGISRAFVIELATAAGLQVREGWPADPIREAFFTCTPRCLVPWTGSQAGPIGDGTPGPITRALTAAWIEAVQCDFIRQAMLWENQMECAGVLC